jgi:hypothetical protein
MQFGNIAVYYVLCTSIVCCENCTKYIYIYIYIRVYIYLLGLLD